MATWGGRWPSAPPGSWQTWSRAAVPSTTSSGSALVRWPGVADGRLPERGGPVSGGIGAPPGARVMSARFSERVGIEARQGPRAEMQDRHVVAIEPEGLFGGVYDGHGGVAVAEAAAGHLHRAFFTDLRRGADPEAAFR